jgi:hypothetical protein
MQITDLPPRIAGHIRVVEDGCWRWTGAHITPGYGTTGWQGKTTYAHRLVYTLLVAPIPPKMVIDHLCRVPDCVFPGHLQVVDNRTNVMRGLRANHKTGICRNGHDLTVVGAVYDKLGRGRCKECKRLKDERYKRKIRGPLKRPRPAVIEQWPVLMRLDDHTGLLRDAGYGDDSATRHQCGRHRTRDQRQAAAEGEGL